MEKEKVGLVFVSAVVEARLESIRRTLCRKVEEYSTDEDRLHNFNVAAQKREAATGKPVSREEAIQWFAEKHDVSIDDIVNMTKEGKVVLNELISEKIGDRINYYILLEASLYASQDQIRLKQQPRVGGNNERQNID